jgi:hypothetical protein
VDNAPTHMVQGFTPEEEHGLKVFNLSNIKLISLMFEIMNSCHPT